VACDHGAVKALSGELGVRMLVPPHPQHCNALGAALFACRGAGRAANRMR